jgi:FkbH-like protein
MDIALAPLRSGRMTLGESDFVAVVASYHAKSAQIRELASRLNLGLDSFVFVDDNPIELAEVSMALPGVRCVPFPARNEDFAAFLSEIALLFDRATVTAEDRERTELYRRMADGLAPSDVVGADLDKFLESLSMKLSVHDRTRGDRVRAVQLINKTNQFNLNGRRVDDAEVAGILAAGGQLYSASLTDRTGAHGEILACLVNADGVITSFVMSCRVFQRRVEHAFTAWLMARAARPVSVDWAATPRNEPFAVYLRAVLGGGPADGLVSIDPDRVRPACETALPLFSLEES